MILSYFFLKMYLALLITLLIVMYIETLSFLGCYRYIFALLHKSKAVISAYEISIQLYKLIYFQMHIITYCLRNFKLKPYIQPCMLYLKITSALQLHLCISNNIKLYHVLKQLYFISVVQNSFLPSLLQLTIFVTTWLILVF